MTSHETVIYFSRLLELELAEAAFKIALVEKYGDKAWKRKRSDGRVRRRAGRLSSKLMQSWGEILDTFPICVLS